jgi:ankyrin repeat protein
MQAKMYLNSQLEASWIVAVRRWQFDLMNDQTTIVAPTVNGLKQFEYLLDFLINIKNNPKYSSLRVPDDKDTNNNRDYDYEWYFDYLKTAQFIGQDGTINDEVKKKLQQKKPKIEVLFNTGSNHYTAIYFTTSGIAYQNPLGNPCPSELQTACKQFYNNFFKLDLSEQELDQCCHFYENIVQQGSSAENTCGDWSLFNLTHFYWHGVEEAPSPDGVLMPRPLMAEILINSLNPYWLAVDESALKNDKGEAVNLNFEVEYIESAELGTDLPLSKYRAKYEDQIALIEAALDHPQLPDYFKTETLELIHSIQCHVDFCKNLPDELVCPHANYVLENRLREMLFVLKNPTKSTHIIPKSVEDLARRLLEGLDVNARDLMGATLLHRICQTSKDIHLASALLLERKVDVDARESFLGNTPLLWAVANANVTMATWLINNSKKYDLDLNKQDAVHLNSALHLAVAKGWQHQSDVHPDGKLACVIECLLQQGANPNLKDCYGNTPLHIAVLRRDMPAVTLLLASGAKLDIKNNQNKLALDMLEINKEQITKAIEAICGVYTLPNPSEMQKAEQELMAMMRGLSNNGASSSGQPSLVSAANDNADSIQTVPDPQISIPAQNPIPAQSPTRPDVKSSWLQNNWKMIALGLLGLGLIGIGIATGLGIIPVTATFLIFGIISLKAVLSIAIFAVGAIVFTGTAAKASGIIGKLKHTFSKCLPNSKSKRSTKEEVMANTGGSTYAHRDLQPQGGGITSKTIELPVEQAEGSMQSHQVIPTTSTNASSTPSVFASERSNPGPIQS